VAVTNEVEHEHRGSGREARKFREEVARLKTQEGTQQEGHQHTCTVCRPEWKHEGEMKPHYVCEMRLVDSNLCWDCFAKIHIDVDTESPQYDLYETWWRHFV
jgi:hypothetical protein